MENKNIPKPTFKTCDETSLTLSWPEFETSNKEIRFEYKKYGQEWSNAKFINIDKGLSEVKIIDITDLDPGTPYFVRLVLYQNNNSEINNSQINNSERNENENIEFGPECVFDTKPIDCTPKKHNCLIQ